MKKDSKKLNLALSVLGVIAFVASFAGALLAYGFDYIKSLLSNEGFLNVTVTVPTSVTVMSFIFFAVLIALAVLGHIFKNKVILLVSVSYQSLLVMSILMLVLFMQADIANATLYSVLQWVLTVLFAPVYGVIWQLGPLFFFIFVPLVIASAVFTVKMFKRERSNKKKR
ncbi:MAG: hypothetical protein E7525_03380 [Ruminococcaceae bacterium]|nr:hypothetical protein [Oscillospiraceae bacterium]